jgi:hypothetical protein
MPRVIKPKICKECGGEYQPVSSLSKVCSVPCARTYTQAQAAKKQAKVDTVARVEANKAHKARKLAVKPRKKWVSEVSVQFNRFIRARDARDNRPCISCGEYYSEPFAGQLWDCGHYKSVGGFPELRWIELNAHRQHSRCNRGAAKSLRNDRTVQQKYRINLIERIGLNKVEWLESNHSAIKPTIEELMFLKKHYSEKAKAAESETAVLQCAD